MDSCTLQATPKALRLTEAAAAERHREKECTCHGWGLDPGWMGVLGSQVPRADWGRRLRALLRPLVSKRCWLPWGRDPGKVKSYRDWDREQARQVAAGLDLFFLAHSSGAP